MKASKDVLDKINNVSKLIVEFAPEMKSENSEIFYSDDVILEMEEDEVEINEIELFFCGEQDYTQIDIEDYLQLGEEIDSLKIVNNGYIKTTKNSYYVVNANDSYEEYLLSDLSNFEYKSENYSIKLINESYIIGLVASKLGLYDDKYWGSISPYLCIQISYYKEKLSEKEETELLNSFIFEIADSTNIALTMSEIQLPDEYYYPDEDNFDSIKHLEPYNEGMKFFTSAVQINDFELKFLNFYKVLEHFAPIAVNIEANELMRKKLDSPKKEFENGDFIRSIYNLADAMKNKFNDEDLIKASFSSCFDFIHLFKFLPDEIKKKIKKQLKQQDDLDYSTNKQMIETASNMVAKIIYKTRNKVVHAKSNFEETGEEVSENDFEVLNDFMKRASSQAIRWYARQPSHYKQKII